MNNNNNYINKDNLSFVNNVFWFDIDEGGYIKGRLNKEAVVYIFRRTSNETRYYVGSSINLTSRLSTHRSRVINECNKDALSIFYSSVRKYGWSSFKFGILESIDLSNTISSEEKKIIILRREQFYFDLLKPKYNICKKAGSPLGVIRDTIFSLNLSRARRGKSIRPRLIANNPSKPIRDETRLKLSARSIGVKVKIYDKLNNLINEFPTLTSAAKYIGVTSTTIRNIVKTGISYDNYIYKIEEKKKQLIVVVNKEKETIKEYHSIRSAAKDIGISYSTILPYVNTNKKLKEIYFIYKK